MGNRIFTVLLFLLVFKNTDSQNSNKIIQLIQSEQNPENIRLSNANNSLFKLPNSLAYHQETQEILKSGNKIYVTLNGTSKVFINTNSDSLERLDETKYDGYNFGAITIIYNDTLYSFGGYGFWLMNGGVRYFDIKNKEWDIIKTNRLVNVANGINCISYFDRLDGKLYLIYQSGYTEYLKDSPKDSKLLIDIFDIKEKSWIKEPLEINSAFASNLKDLDCIAKMEEGIIVNSSKLGSAYFLNLRENKAFSIGGNKITEIIQLKGKHPNNLIYSAGNNLKIFDREIDSLFSISFSKNIMEPTSMNIYKSQLISFNTKSIIITLLIVIGLLIINISILQFYKLRKIKKSLIIQKEKTPDFADFISILEVIERQVLKTIYENSLNNLNTTTYQLNKILGTEKKDLKIQNNIRSEIILSINKKFKACTSINEELIERERAENDKRFMEYLLNKLLINKLNPKFF